MTTLTYKDFVEDMHRRGIADYADGMEEIGLYEWALRNQDDFPIQFYSASVFTEQKQKQIREAFKTSFPGTILTTSTGDGFYIKAFLENPPNVFAQFGMASDASGNIHKFWLKLMGTDQIPESLAAFFEEYKISIKRLHPKDISVVYAMPSKAGIYTQRKSFSPVPFESIHKNYTPAVVSAVQTMLAELKEAKSGLVLLHGAVGTGKTYLIRSILSELNTFRDGLICVPPTDFLNNVGNLQEALRASRNPIVIFEDLGDVFQKDAKTRWINEFSSLLNMTDGLLSLLNNAIYLLTFNYKMDDIDDALTRPGRCLANIEVPTMSANESLDFLEIDSHAKIRSGSHYTLAELYAIKKGEKAIRTTALDKDRIGFRPRVLQPISRYEDGEPMHEGVDF